MKYFVLILILLLSSASGLQYTIGPSKPVVPPPPPPSGGVTDENYYDNVDGTCKNMGVSDGPAALPNRCFNTAMENTPAGPAFYCVVFATQVPPPSCNGSVANYASPTAAFAAISSGVIPCGSIVKIVATSDGTPHGQQNTYVPSNLKYPARVCDAQHWIIVETDMIDQLPPEGSRISPAWVGVPSLPGRPSYAQPAVPGVYMPKITAGAWQSASIALTAGANATSPASSYVRFIGIEFVQPVPGAAVCTGKNCQTGWQYRILDTSCGPADGNLACPDHVIFDRVIVTPDDHTGRSTVTVCMGGQLTGRSFALINSYLFQIAGRKGYCEPKVTGAGNTKSLDQGPYKFYNNFMEGGAENYFWGGGETYSNASDIQLRHSHMFKPWTLWMAFRSDYIGTVMAIKNNGESKSAIRMLLEGNLYEYTWYGGDINGTTVGDQFAVIVLVHGAQGKLDGTHADVAQDLVFRYNIVRHGARGAGLDLAGCSSSALLGCGNIPPGRTTPVLQRIIAHDNVFDDISGKWYTQPYNNTGNGFDGTGANTTNPVLNVGNNVTINNIWLDHNTFIPSSYNTDLTVASIVVGTGGSATLTATGRAPFIGSGMGPGMNPGKKIQIFGSCPGFNQYANIATFVSGDPQVIFTYTGAPANQTCNSGYVSLLTPKQGAAFGTNEGAYDRQIISLWQTGTQTSAIVRGWNGTMVPCAMVGVPAGCTKGMEITVWGVTGANACYNNLQAGCGTDGQTQTPASYELVGRGYCNGVGTGTFPAGSPDPGISKCKASGDYIFMWNHIQSGLAEINPGNAFVSYWPFLGRYNYGPEPNLRWEGIRYTNNIGGGRGANMSAQTFTNCTTQISNNTQTMLDNCGVVATTGPGAYQFRCNVIASWPFINSVANPTDILPPDNTDTPDRTLQSVGFVNFNYDNLGMGVDDMSDLVLAPTSPFKGGLPNCDGKDPGADIPLLKQYTAGVE